MVRQIVKKVTHILLFLTHIFFEILRTKKTKFYAMKPAEFVKAYLPFAKQTETKTGISAIAILAQAALESGWGEHAPGNMFFGIKADGTWQGKRQLVTTTEYHNTPKVSYPEIISIEPINGKYKYKVKDWFRAYDTPEQCFTDHTTFFFKNPRYKGALQVKGDPYGFIDAIAAAGYATAPDYAKTLKGVARTIEKFI